VNRVPKPIHSLVWLPVAMLTVLLPACDRSRDAVLQVEEVKYAADEVGRLTPDQLATLADLTGFGIAMARDDLGPLIEPLVERVSERAVADQLPWLLAEREMELGEEDLRSLYESDPNWELTVRHAVRLVPSWAGAEDRRAAREAVEAARQRVLAGEDFGAVAGEVSEEPGAAERGGLLQPGRAGTWVEPFWRTAQALEPGEVSPVVETEYGFHVIRLEGREPLAYAEADRAELLRRAIPEERAGAALGRWMNDPLVHLALDDAAIVRAAELAEAGDAPDTLVIARWTDAAGAERQYTARDMALFRASLDGEELDRLAREGEGGLVGRVARDAEQAFWGSTAMSLGAPARPAPEARQVLVARAARWAAALGFRRGMTSEEVRGAALRALAAAGQEPSIARQEIVAWRTLLRAAYPASGSAFDEGEASSSSRTENSDRTG
jgi:hypothetical protein